MSDSEFKPNNPVPADLHDEPGMGRTALQALALMVLPPILFSLSISANPSASALQVYRPTLVPIPPTFARPAPPSRPAPPAPADSAKATPPTSAPAPTPSAAELALKKVRDSLKEDKEKREAEAEKARKKKEEAEEEKRRKEKEEEKRKAEEEKKKQREKENREVEEKKRKEDEAKKKEREAEELAERVRQREEEEREARAREAEARAAELRAQEDARARADELVRLADLQGIYKSRVIRQIENELETPPALVGRKDVVVEVRVLLHPDGELNGWPTVTRSSGFPDYDEEAIRAVLKAAPLVIPTDEPELLHDFLRLDLDIRPK